MLSRIKFNHFDRKKWSIEMKISSKERDKSYLKGFLKLEKLTKNISFH